MPQTRPQTRPQTGPQTRSETLGPPRWRARLGWLLIVVGLVLIGYVAWQF